MASQSGSISVVVPTVGRPDALQKCVRSIGAQTRPPSEVVVVDDGDIDDAVFADLRDTLPDPTTLEVTASDGPAGTAVARNTGARTATGDIVLFIDDDVELGPEYLDRLTELYEQYDDETLAGVGGFDEIAPPSGLGELFVRAFRLGEPWRINRAGMSTLRPDENLDAGLPTRTDWLTGNNMSFKRSVITDHQFLQWNGGREVHEDLGVGWALKNDGYHCIVDPALPIDHHEVRSGEPDLRLWIDAGRNRVRLFRRYGERRDFPLFLYAAAGEALRQVGMAATSGNVRRHLTNAAGLLVGVCSQLLSETEEPTV